MTPYILHYAPDNSSLCVRLALEELGVAYDTTLVDRRHQGQRTPGYLRLNPSGLIPVLETPQGALFETAAILLWLADTHGKLAAAVDAPERGDLLKWLFFLSNTLHPALRMLFYPETYVGAGPAAQATLRAVQRRRIEDYLEILDAEWEERETPDIRDLYLGPMLRWCALYPTDADRSWFDLSAFPALHQMATMLETRPSTHAAQTAEGLGPTPFTAPRAPEPPEGSAT